MSDAVIGGLMGEVRRHPYTTVTTLAVFIFCLIGTPILWTKKADASDVRALAAQISEVNETVKRESKTAELRSVRTELFDLNQRISTLERASQAVDLLLYQRRDELFAQQRRLEAQLQAMDAKQ